MKFQKFDLGHRQRGDVVLVELSGDSVNVQLMQSQFLAAYKAGRSYRSIGGHVSKSPYRAVIPNGGHWIVTIDRGGYAVNSRASVSVERPTSRILPPAQSATESIADVGRNLAQAHAAARTEITHDVMISHASEDKGDVARPLHDLLVARGLTVWLDEIKMKVGTHLRRSIDHAVATSRYGVVVMSPAFFAKEWTQYELDGLVAREMNGEQLILPIWHHLTKDQLLAVSPSLADRLALNTATQTLDEIAGELYAAIQTIADP